MSLLSEIFKNFSILCIIIWKHGSRKMLESPFEEIKRLQRRINLLFSRFFNFPERERVLLPSKKGWDLFREPLSGLKETENEVVASIALPGVDKKDIKLNITDNRLEVKVEKKDETNIEKKGFFKEEKFYKGFYRSISLPCKVDAGKTNTSYKNGVLKVVMPKMAENEKKRIFKIR